MNQLLRKFIPFTKVDAAKREVGGVVTAQVKDKQGETCHYKTTMPYYKDWSDSLEKASAGKNLGNLREMHGLSAAGVGKTIEFNDDDQSIFMTFKVVDDDAWKKVEEGVYTGFSQGGSYIKRWKESGTSYYTAQPSEVSLVDNPCLPTATFEFVRADGSSEMRKFANVEADAAVEPPVEIHVNGDLPPVTIATIAKAVAKHLAEVKDAKDAKDAEAAAAEPITVAKRTLEQRSEGIKAMLKANIPAIFEVAANKLGLAKGMYEIGRFADLLSSLAYIRYASITEREYEGDDSKIPEKLMSDLESLAECFLQMTQEEVKELLESAAQAGKGGTLRMNYKVTDLSKADQDALAKVISGMSLEKAAGFVGHLRGMHKSQHEGFGKMYKILGVDEATEFGDGHPESKDPKDGGTKNIQHAGKTEIVGDMLKIGTTEDGVDIFRKATKEEIAAYEANATYTKAELNDLLTKNSENTIQMFLEALSKADDEDGECSKCHNPMDKCSCATKVAKVADGIGDRARVPVIANNGGPVLRVMPVTKAQDNNNEPITAVDDKVDIIKALQGDPVEALKLMKSAKPADLPATVATALSGRRGGLAV